MKTPTNIHDVLFVAVMVIGCIFAYHYRPKEKSSSKILFRYFVSFEYTFYKEQISIYDCQYENTRVFILELEYPIETIEDLHSECFRKIQSTFEYSQKLKIKAFNRI